MILGLPLIGTRSSRRSRCRQDASQPLRQHRLCPSRRSRDRSGPVKDLHPISQSLKELKTRGNEQMIERARKRLSKRAKRGFRGYPLATVALYGPDDRTAIKLAVGIMPAEHADATELPGPGSPRRKRRRQYRSGLLSKLCLWRCTQRHHKAQANIDAAAPRLHRLSAAQLGLL